MDNEVPLRTSWKIATGDHRHRRDDSAAERLGCQRSFSNRIYVDFDSPPGVHAGAVVLMNGAEIGRTAKPVLPEEGEPKIRVPVSLKRDRSPNESRCQNCARRSWPARPSIPWKR